MSIYSTLGFQSSPSGLTYPFFVGGSRGDDDESRFADSQMFRTICLGKNQALGNSFSVLCKATFFVFYNGKPIFRQIELFQGDLMR
jgi:hypothetical protein